MKALVRLCTLIFVFKMTHTRPEGLDPEELGGMIVYYDGNMKPVPLLTTITEIGPTLRTPSLRFGFMPCSCEGLTCGCCVNMNIQTFNFEREGCMKFTYDPYEFSIGMNMLFDNSTVYENSVSAKNPPPLCMPVPVPYIPSVDFCVKLYNIFTPGRNIHMCINFETKLIRVPVLVLQFDCVKMGADGVSLWKPSENAGITPQVEDIEPVENAEVTEAAESSENAEAVVNAAGAESSADVEDPSSVENSEPVSNSQGVKNVTDVENLNAESATDVENLNAETATDIDNLNLESDTDVENLNAETATDIDNLNIESATDVENLNADTATAADILNLESTTVATVAEDFNVESATETENLNFESATDVENVADVENVTRVENFAVVESPANDENDAGTENFTYIENITNKTTESIESVKPNYEYTDNNIITTDNEIPV